MPTTYALLSTYPPTQCGLATFAAALLDHLPQPGDRVAVVRVLEEMAPHPAPCRAPEVVHDLVAGSAASASGAADVLNGFDVVIAHHEYGIYGGPDGQDVISLLEGLHVPTIVVLHTVLANPSPRQRMILNRVMAAASAVVTMTHTARSRLLDGYDIAIEKISVIPHGAPDNRVAARPTGPPVRPRVLTWGLLAPRKGIEHAIDAIGCSAIAAFTSTIRSPARLIRGSSGVSARPTGGLCRPGRASGRSMIACTSTAVFSPPPRWAR